MREAKLEFSGYGKVMEGKGPRIAPYEAKCIGKFVILGVVPIKTRQEKATRAGNRVVFGKVVMVKAGNGTSIATSVAKYIGKFVIPGVVTVKTRQMKAIEGFFAPVEGKLCGKY